jgi:catechol 2,3-dioxygenase-like lactoylglutathione lyase family enzyme
MLDLRSICPLLQVFDMPASLAFYRDLLGFEIVEAAPPEGRVKRDAYDWVWLRRDGLNLMLNTAYDPDAVRPPAPEPARVAAHDDTALYIGAPDVDGVYEHLRSRGVRLGRPVVAPYGMKQLQLRDPDGFGVCFQWPAAKDGYHSGASP